MNLYKLLTILELSIKQIPHSAESYWSLIYFTGFGAIWWEILVIFDVDFTPSPSEIKSTSNNYQFNKWWLINYSGQWARISSRGTGGWMKAFLGCQALWVQTVPWTLLNCERLGTSLNLSVSPFSYLYNEANNTDWPHNI